MYLLKFYDIFIVKLFQDVRTVESSTTGDSSTLHWLVLEESEALMPKTFKVSVINVLFTAIHFYTV